MKPYRVYRSKYIGMKPEPVNPRYIEIDRQMQLGYQFYDDCKEAKAIKCWIDVWNQLMDVMQEKSIKTFKEFDRFLKAINLYLIGLMILMIVCFVLYQIQIANRF